MGRNTWLAEQLELYKAHCMIHDLSGQLNLNPRNYTTTIKKLCERNQELQTELKASKSRGVKRSLTTSSR